MQQTILVVDDDRKVRESIGAVLRDEGYKVETASTGTGAMGKLAGVAAGLVLVDVWMPEMDGIELLQQIRRARQDLPVIIVSGHGNVETAVRATKLGAADFIEKPFSIEALLSSIRRALASSSEEKRAAASQQTGAARRKLVSGRRVSERTLARSVVGGGQGLYSGVNTGLILHPAPAGSGIRFGRVAGEGHVDALVENVDSTGYATTLHSHGMTVRTVEHLMATLHAYGVTNLLIKVEGEVPILDGSAVEFCRLVESAGVEDQGSELAEIEIDEEIRLDFEVDEFISITPCDHFEITYELSYPEPVGEQAYTFVLDGAQSFRSQIAPARTFGFVDEIRALERAGLGKGGQLGNFILIGESGLVNTELRFPEELARHKILDVMGDSYLLGVPLRGAIHARKTGHAANVALMKAVRDRLKLDSASA